jgi:hypothetical protein
VRLRLSAPVLQHIAEVAAVSIWFMALWRERNHQPQLPKRGRDAPQVFVPVAFATDVSSRMIGMTLKGAMGISASQSPPRQFATIISPRISDL